MLIITAAERLKSPCRRFRSIIDYIVINDLCGSAADIIHPTNPCHLIIYFKFFGHALTLCHLLYEPRKHFFCLLIEVCKVSVQFASCQQIKIQCLAILLDIP